MELSQRFVDTLVERLVEEGVVTDYASEYGEPGYRFYGDGTQRFLIGDWWCKCGEFHRYPDGRLERRRGYNDEHGPPNPNRLHDVQSHHPRLWQQLESQGVEVAFYDEWMVDYETGKAYRTTGDSYHWQPSVVCDDNGEWMTPDTDIEVWVDWARNTPTRCLFDWQRSDLESAGFENVNGVFEAGWFEGQTDDPVKLLKRYQDATDDRNAEFVFMIDENSQFYTKFVLYRRGEEVDDDD